MARLDETITAGQAGHISDSQILARKANYIFDVKDYGATGDGVTDDTAAIQAAIDAAFAAGGGYVLLPVGTFKAVSLILKSGVTITGQLGAATISSSSEYATRIHAFATGVVIDTSGTCLGGKVEHLKIQGLGAGTAGSAIRFGASTKRCQVRNVTVDSFADEGIVTVSGSVACSFEDILLVNCLLDRSQAAKIGAMDVDGTDHWLSRIEATTSQSALSDVNLYLCAFVVRSSSNMFFNCIGEISDVGFHFIVGANNNSVVGSRADLNYGNGFEVLGARNKFVSTLSYRNSQETDDTYDGFVVSGSGNTFASCVSSGLVSDSNQPRYGYRDTVNTTTVADRSRYASCLGEANQTALWSVVAFSGSTPDLAHVRVNATDADETPSVENSTYLRLAAYTTPTTITDFDDAVGTQMLTVLGDSNVTIEHNANIKTVTGADTPLSDNVAYMFQHENGVWYQVGV